MNIFKKIFVAVVALGLVFGGVNANASNVNNTSVISAPQYSNDFLNKMKSTVSYVKFDSLEYEVGLDSPIKIKVLSTYLDKTEKDVTSSAKLSVDDKKIATIDNKGIVTPKKVGYTIITANYNNAVIKSIVVVKEKTDNKPEQPVIIEGSVVNYGAKGNDLLEDTLAFQSAINDVASKGGGDVYVPSGTYILNPIYIKSNVNLIGENKDTTILKLSDGANSKDQTRLVNVANASNVKIENLTLDGNWEKHTDGTEHMHTVFIWDSKNVKVNNNVMQNARGDGISVTGSTKTSENIVISNSKFIDNHRSNIVIEQVHNIEVFGNTSISTIGRPVLHFEPWEEVNYQTAKIHDNLFETNSDGYSIQIHGNEVSDVYYFNGIEFYNNIVKGEKGSFLLAGTKDAKIYNNKLEIDKFFLWQSNRDLKIYNNDIKANEGFDVNGHLGNSIDTVISNNNVETNGDAIIVRTSGENVSFLNNVFKGNGNGKSVYIWANTGTIKNTIIKGNTFDNYKDGVYVTYYRGNEVDKLHIEENTFENIETYALFLQGYAKNIYFDKNKVINSSGVLLQNIDGKLSNIEITNNDISGGKAGVHQWQAYDGVLDGLKIIGNKISGMTGIGKGTYTGAVIELEIYSKPTNVDISKNTLINNKSNFITVPDYLKGYVVDNTIIK